jgi:carboxyl-terminal processing protease
MNRLLLILFFLLYIPSAIAEKSDNKPDNKAIYQKFQEIFEKTVKDYAEEPDKQKMLDNAIAGMVSSLDPYSNYMKGDELEGFVEWAKGEFGGIGVEIVFEGASAIKIISPIDDLAADKAGIKPGDYIIAVNGEAVANIGHMKAVKSLRGEPGTKVKVTIVREGENQVKEYELTRDVVKLKTIKFNRDGDIAYLRIVTFNEVVISELKKAMKVILEKSKTPIKGIILDLRNNPGGLLDQGVAVSEYFLDSGEIVSTKGRIPESNNVYSASKFVPKAPKVPVVILINSGSASASEIVAGALQDHKRAVIMGTKSYGKGSVQLFMPMDGGTSALYLTIGKYYTPSGICINGKGIIPDIIVDQIKMEYTKQNETDRKISDAVLKSYLKDSAEKKAKEDKKVTKEKENIAIEAEKKEDIKNENPQMSDMYKNDYQYSRAYDIIYGMSLGINVNTKEKP